MTIPINSADVYTDFQGLDKLRVAADKNDPQAMVAAAKQFEALFIQQMLKSMREASLAQGAFDSDEGRVYLDMFDKQISLTMAQGKGLGLADMLVKQLRNTVGKVEDIHNKQTTSTPANSDAALMPGLSPGKTAQRDTVHNASLHNASLETPAVQNSQTHTQSLATEQTQHTSAEITDFPTPESFVQHLWPLAQRAGQQLGVEPKVLLAQAALETGWGRNINKNADGSSSYNLFNIKSDGRWQGDAVNVSTLEFRDGIAVKEAARFRAYSGYAGSFNDYVDFIQSNPRYHTALQQAEDPERYSHALQQAGYATDPGYANKIMGIVNGVPMQQALETIKISMGETITSKDGS